MVHAYQAIQRLESLSWDVDAMPDGEAKTKLAAKLEDCQTYIDNNQNFIVNYGGRFRHGDPIASGFVESAVNQVVAKRFVKQQQMRWSDQNAHRLLQVRTAELNRQLRRADRLLMHLWVALAVFVLRRARGTDDGRIDNVPVVILMPLRLRCSFTLTSSFLPSLCFSSRWLNLHTVVSSGAPFTPRSMPTKLRMDTESYNASSDRRVRQVEPQLQKIYPQHTLQRQRPPASRLTNLCIKRLNYRSQLPPGHNHLHISEKKGASRYLAVPFESRQCLLLHHPVRARVVVFISDTVGKSEFP